MKNWLIFGGMFLIWLGVWYFTKPKTAYVNVKEVFEQFSYTKKLRNELSVVKNARRKQLDSINFELKVMAQKVSDGKHRDLQDVFEVKRKEYILLERQFNDDNMALTDKYDSEIHAQMKSYLADFGKENGYDYLFGTEELGTVLFAKDRFNATSKAIEFINKRFEGKK